MNLNMSLHPMSSPHFGRVELDWSDDTLEKELTSFIHSCNRSKRPDVFKAYVSRDSDTAEIIGFVRPGNKPEKIDLYSKKANTSAPWQAATLDQYRNYIASRSDKIAVQTRETFPPDDAETLKTQIGLTIAQAQEPNPSFSHCPYQSVCFSK